MVDLFMLETLLAKTWDQYFPDSAQRLAITSLEDGNILFFPELNFDLTDEEKVFLTPAFSDPHAKNISYQSQLNKLWGVQHLTDSQHQQLKAMLNRFSQYSFSLIKHLLPHYAKQLVTARTSYRPVEVSNRVTSYRKDDRRLHVDAFPSAPNQGKRILRVFCNINPNGESRVWRIGEPFSAVVDQFIHQIKKPVTGSAALLRLLKITKSYRTLYDHYMLQLHNLMKSDETYQANAKQQEVKFPPGTTWIVQTDDVSHAAMKGQYVLEQTFYLPVKAMLDETKSPLRILEKKLNQKLT